jgi:hypothetical protein
MLIGAVWHRLRGRCRDRQRLLYLAVTFGGLLSGRLVSLALDGGIAGYGHTIVAPTRLMQAALRWPLLCLFSNTGLNATRRAQAMFTSHASDEAARDGWLFIGGLRSRFGGEA